MITRRRAIGFTSATFVALAAACAPASSVSLGNRIVTPPTLTPASQALTPSNWNTTTVPIGSSTDELTSLHFIQRLQIPTAQIPFITPMTFLAPKDVPLVMIGLYYERSDKSRAARDLLTGGAFGLQQITDLDWPLTYQPDQIKTVQSEKVTSEQLGWFSSHRVDLVQAMKSSARGAALGAHYDCDFTSRARPAANTPVALVVAGGNYGGAKVPFTVIAQRLVFSASLP